MRPTTIRKTIEERHASIEFLIRSDVREELQELRSYLSQIKNIHRLLSKVKEHKATPNDWQHILKVKDIGQYASIKIRYSLHIILSASLVF